MQSGELRSGVADVAAHGRVGPLAAAVAVKAQVQPDEFGDLVDDFAAELQRLQPLRGELGPDHFVVVEGHPAPCFVPTRFGLADVVEQGREAQDEVGAAGRIVARLKVDGLLEHRERVVVNVLVPMVLIDLEAQRGQFGQHLRGQPGLDQHVESGPGVGAHDELDEFFAHALGRHDRDALGHVDHRRMYLRRNRKAQLRHEARSAHHAQRIVTERLLRRARRAQHPRFEIGETIVQVNESQVRQRQRHRVDGEVAANQIVGQRGTEGDLGLARIVVVGLRAIRRDLDYAITETRADRAEANPHIPLSRGAGGEQASGLKGRRRRGQVQVGHIGERSGAHGVANRSAHERQLKTGRGKALAQIGKQRPGGPERGCDSSSRAHLIHRTPHALHQSRRPR